MSGIRSNLKRNTFHDTKQLCPSKNHFTTCFSLGPIAATQFGRLVCSADDRQPKRTSVSVVPVSLPLKIRSVEICSAEPIRSVGVFDDPAAKHPCTA